MKPTDLASPPEAATTDWKLLDFDRQLAAGTRWDEFAEALHGLPEILSPPNTIATLLTPTGDTISIGVAGPRDSDNPGLDRDLASIEFNRASQDPPYLAVVGDPSLTFENGGVIVFYYANQWTEILRRNCVPIDVMIRIVKEFFETNALPEWIGWEEV